MSWLLAYVALGLFTGLSAGTLGIGGGMITVPVLTMIFAAQGSFPPGEVLHLALGTSMATIVFTSFASLRAHHSHGAVLWNVVLQITPGILLGTLIGSMLAAHVSARPLAIFFSVVVTLIAIQMALNLKPKAARELPGAPGIIAAGIGIGSISSLAAIAGGAFTISFLTWCNVRMQQAIGTAAAVGFPIAIGGTVGYVFNGWNHADLPPWSCGFVYLPAMLWMMVPSMLMAPIGARLSHRLPVSTLRRIFACLLIAMAARMVWQLFS